MTDTLGPFQAIWDAWDEVDTEIKNKEFKHFARAVEIQYEELDDHLHRKHDREAAAREAVDVISVALNTLRWMDYKPEAIADIARARANKRMRGQGAAILQKYDDLVQHLMPPT